LIGTSECRVNQAGSQRPCRSLG